MSELGQTRKSGDAITTSALPPTADIPDSGCDVKAKIAISQHPRRAKPLDIDTDIYKWRHLIENFFSKLKEFKRIAMRSDKTDSSFEAMIYLATAVIHSR